MPRTEIRSIKCKTLHQLLGSPVASPKGFHKSFHVNCSPLVILLTLKLGWFTFRCSTADWPPAHSMALSTVSNLLSRVLKSFSLDCFRFEKTNLVSVSVPLLPWLNPLSPYFHLRFFSIFPFQWTAQPPWTAAPRVFSTTADVASRTTDTQRTSGSLSTLVDTPLTADFASTSSSLFITQLTSTPLSVSLRRGPAILAPRLPLLFPLHE